MTRAYRAIGVAPAEPRSDSKSWIIVEPRWPVDENGVATDNCTHISAQFFMTVDEFRALAAEGLRECDRLEAVKTTAQPEPKP